MSDSQDQSAKTSNETVSKTPSSIFARFKRPIEIFHKTIKAKSKEEDFQAWAFIVNSYQWIGAIIIGVLVSTFFYRLSIPPDAEKRPPEPSVTHDALVIEPTKREFLGHKEDALSFRITVLRPVWIYCLLEDMSDGTASLLFPANSPASDAATQRRRIATKRFQPGIYTLPSSEFGLDAPNLLPTEDPGFAQLSCLSANNRAPNALEQRWLELASYVERKKLMSAAESRQLVEDFRQAGFEVAAAKAAIVPELSITNK
ncbi:hypothetical protein [Bradyrhizobium genosp. A]|uniref:hypothetical protein n=1 Tax=Bradyrhizobium genosp. A TaxID=83626 RepID=UPI003CE9BDB0